MPPITPTGNTITDATAAEAALIAELRALGTDTEADGEAVLADAKAQGSSLWTAIVGAVKAAKSA
jgi:hypothetical protein